MRPSRSSVFTVWNAQSWAYKRQGRATGRLNRALGLLMRSDGGESHLEHYQTTADRCQCDDQKYRPGEVCKHRWAFLVRFVALELDELRGREEEVA